jgi:glucose-6-phosphate isomerase
LTTLFIQGTIWQIYSFNKREVGLGKMLVERIIPEIKSVVEAQFKHDSSTNTLILRYRN